MRKKEIYELDIKGNIIGEVYESATLIADTYGMYASGVIRIYTNIRKKIENDLSKVSEFHIQIKSTKYIFIEKDFYLENEDQIKAMFTKNARKKSIDKKVKIKPIKPKKPKTKKKQEKDVLLINVDKNSVERRFRSENPILDVAKELGVARTTILSRIERGVVFNDKYMLDCDFIKKIYMYRQG